MDLSFYGHQKGRDFVISSIFANTQDLEADLRRSWTSPVNVGEYVMISYGEMNSPEYRANKEIDRTAKGKNYNATLWRKDYLDKHGNGDAGGLTYTLLASLAGNTPKIELQETNILNANDFPNVSIEEDVVDPDYYRLTFSLPQSQVMGNPTTSIIGPSQMPTVGLNKTNVNAPFLKFSLPRAVKFYYGDKLGKREAITYTEISQDFEYYMVGDYYINSATGFIYLITAKTGNQCTFVYQASIQQPLPNVVTQAINPYIQQSGVFVPTQPEVSRAFINADRTEWQLTFRMPKTPAPRANIQWLGPEEENAGVSTVISSETSIDFNFRIPKGAKIFSGLDVTNNSSPNNVGASAGDIYLNTETGYIFKRLDSSWEQQVGTLKGPAGDNLNIVKNYRLSTADTLSDGTALTNNVAIIGQYIEENQDDPNKEITPDELFGVTWHETDEQGGTTDISYWYFKALNGAWGALQLTGGIGSIINTKYNDEDAGPVDDKTYSISYINTLINDTDDTITNPVIQTYSVQRINAKLDEMYQLLQNDIQNWGTFDENGLHLDSSIPPSGGDTPSPPVQTEDITKSWGNFDENGNVNIDNNSSTDEDATKNWGNFDEGGNIIFNSDIPTQEDTTKNWGSFDESGNIIF